MASAPPSDGNILAVQMRLLALQSEPRHAARSDDAMINAPLRDSFIGMTEIGLGITLLGALLGSSIADLISRGENHSIMLQLAWQRREAKRRSQQGRNAGLSRDVGSVGSAQRRIPMNRLILLAAMLDATGNVSVP